MKTRLEEINEVKGIVSKNIDNILDRLCKEERDNMLLWIRKWTELCLEENDIKRNIKK